MLSRVHAWTGVTELFLHHSHSARDKQYEHSFGIIDFERCDYRYCKINKSCQSIFEQLVQVFFTLPVVFIFFPAFFVAAVYSVIVSGDLSY